MAPERRDMRASRDGRVSILLFCSCIVLLFNTIFPLQKEERGIGDGTSENSSLQLQFVLPETLRLEEEDERNPIENNGPPPVQFSSLFFSPVQINNAPKDILMTVRGVGAVLADEIIRYRDQYGNFNGYEDLLYLKGVGEKRAENIRQFFSFTTTP